MPRPIGALSKMQRFMAPMPMGIPAAPTTQEGVTAALVEMGDRVWLGRPSP